MLAVKPLWQLGTTRLRTIRARIRVRYENKPCVYVGLVHRSDCETSQVGLWRGRPDTAEDNGSKHENPRKLVMRLLVLRRAATYTSMSWTNNPNSRFHAVGDEDCALPMEPQKYSTITKLLIDRSVFFRYVNTNNKLNHIIVVTAAWIQSICTLWVKKNCTLLFLQ